MAHFKDNHQTKANRKQYAFGGIKQGQCEVEPLTRKTSFDGNKKYFGVILNFNEVRNGREPV